MHHTHVSPSPCPSPDALLELARGTAAPDALAKGQAHLAECSSCRAALASVLAPSETVRLGGRFRLVEKLGAGATGEVWSAVDEQLERMVAVKRLRLPTGAPGFALRLVREARTLARIAHPNVLQVLEVGLDAQRAPFLVCELASKTLADALATKPGWEPVVRWFLDAARGLAAAHEAGIVHRDFKPANVLMLNGVVKVADFGLATQADAWEPAPPGELLGALSLTASGAVVGTPAYLAPELRAGEAGGPASDQYAFALSLVEGLTGTRLAPGAALPPLPGPRALRKAVERALAIDPTQRHPSMHALADALESALGAKRRRQLVVGGSLLAVLAIGAYPAALGWQKARACSDGPQVWKRLGPGDAVTALEQALGEGEVLARAKTRLQRFEAAWRSAWVASCEDQETGSGAVDSPQERRHCLEADASLLASAVSMAGLHAKAHPDRVVPALDAVPAPGQCLSAGRGLEPRLSASADTAMSREVDALYGLRSLDELDAAEKEAATLLERARQEKRGALEAELGAVLGLTLYLEGRGEAALPILREAVLASERAGVDVVRLKALTHLAFIHSESLNRHEEAQALMSQALALVERLTPGQRDDNVEYVRGMMLLAQYKGAEAEAVLSQVPALMEGRGRSPADRIQVMLAWSESLSRLHREHDAVPKLQAAMQLGEESYGADAYVTGLARMHLAHTLGKLGRSREALPLFERVLEHDRGSIPINRLSSQRMKALLLARLGRLEDARKEIDDVVAKTTVQVDPGAVARPQFQRALMQVALMQGDLATAEAAATHELEYLRAVIAGRHQRAGEAYCDQAEVALAKGEPERAAALVRSAAASFPPNALSSLGGLCAWRWRLEVTQGAERLAVAAQVVKLTEGNQELVPRLARARALELQHAPKATLLATLEGLEHPDAEAMRRRAQ